jgi:hypothetical protein
MQRLQALFDRFLRERVYVNNITPATLLFRPGGVAAAEVLILAVRAKPE